MTNLLFVLAVIGVAVLAWFVVAVIAAYIWHRIARREGLDLTTSDGTRYRIERFNPEVHQ